MMRYNIRINTGDDNHQTTFFFVHKDWKNVSQEESDAAFDKAVKEIDHIYKTYGRFATEVGVARLFNAFGFERTISD